MERREVNFATLSPLGSIQIQIRVEITVLCFIAAFMISLLQQ